MLGKKQIETVQRELHSGPIGGGAREGEQWSDREKQKKRRGDVEEEKKRDR